MQRENEQTGEEKAEETEIVIQLAVIDRFEGKLAVLSIGDGDEEETLDVPRLALPKGAKSGVHLRVQIENGQLISATIDEAATADTQLRIENKLARLRRSEHLKD